MKADAPRRKHRSSSRPMRVVAPRWAVVGIFVILLVGLLYVARDFLMPLALAFLLALVFSPVARFAGRRGVPAAVSAFLLVLVIVLSTATAVYMLSGPVGRLAGELPYLAARVEHQVAGVAWQLRRVIAASDRVEELAAPSRDPEVQEVVVREPDLLTSIATGAPQVAAKFLFAVILLLFLLASGDLFYEKMVRAASGFANKRRAVTIAYAIERELSRYLFTITLINAGLGTAVGLAMWAAGMPNPVLWGVLAALLNYVPYVGALVGISLAGLVGLATFDTFGEALVPPALYFMLNLVEGQVVTPAVVGRRLELNTVAVFVSIAFWGWLWGIVGMLMAVPLLVSLAIVCRNVPGLANLGEFLAGRSNGPPPGEADADEPSRAKTLPQPSPERYSTPAR